LLRVEKSPEQLGAASGIGIHSIFKALMLSKAF
jgi:hypothetical protein